LHRFPLLLFFDVVYRGFYNRLIDRLRFLQEEAKANRDKAARFRLLEVFLLCRRPRLLLWRDTNSGALSIWFNRGAQGRRRPLLNADNRPYREVLSFQAHPQSRGYFRLLKPFGNVLLCNSGLPETSKAG
jgi:hypothetical protein